MIAWALVPLLDPPSYGDCVGGLASEEKVRDTSIGVVRFPNPLVFSSQAKEPKKPSIASLIVHSTAGPAVRLLQ